MRRMMRVAIADPLLHVLVDRVIDQRRRQKMERGLGLRLIDMLAFSSAPPIIERGEHRKRAETRRDVVGISAERSRRWPIRPSAQIVKARYCRGHIAETDK